MNTGSFPNTLLRVAIVHPCREPKPLLRSFNFPKIVEVSSSPNLSSISIIFTRTLRVLAINGEKKVIGINAHIGGIGGCPADGFIRMTSSIRRTMIAASVAEVIA